ncbi:hypothetical protein EZV62_021605 [Acer yangbiense]|uniref:Uncharacterized protein n=1 Tax=Acer yangbiense TaxID=1000413 RepID=A0A5C7H8A4_9ROSI|nr:hypothetical protein EZV62_021605 [Acer yangbiense]
MLLYSYSHVIHGFSARLTALQLSGIEKSPAHLATYPESFGKLFTTHSPKFLGLKSKSGLWPAASYGEARGVAARAHIAMYKVLWETDAVKSAASNVLAGMDQAIANGVDIMSLSLGFDPTSIFKGVIAIGYLSANQTIHNGAPWITTVGAGTLDRSFHATITLDNGMTFKGISYYPESIYIVDAPLYYDKGNVNKTTCNMGALNPDEVAGKVVLCDNGTIDVYGQMMEVNRVGAYAAIFLTDMSDLDAEDYSIPSLTLPTSSGILIREYVTGWKKPMLKRMKFVLTEFGTKPAPQVASFSSRGPDPISPVILKPDILAPGVDVLAAVAPNIPYIEIAVHKDWSPAAVRSAIMTTAYTIDNTGTILKDENTGLPATPLEFGAGHINPNKAMDPGLIYDINFQDYTEFLCGIGYDEKQMKIVL